MYSVSGVTSISFTEIEGKEAARFPHMGVVALKLYAVSSPISRLPPCHHHQVFAILQTVLSTAREPREYFRRQPYLEVVVVSP